MSHSWFSSGCGSKLTQARMYGGKLLFLKEWLKYAKHQWKYKGCRLQFLHDQFVGTRELDERKRKGI